jgi:hypothetical protein
MNPGSRPWIRPRENRERERFLGKKWPVPDFLTIHGQEIFSRMAQLQGHSRLHERYGEQFTGDKW